MSSFDFFERSNYGSVPTTLYRFQMDNLVWTYASGDEDIFYEGATYIGCGCSDSGFVQSGEAASDEFTVTLPSTAELTHLFRGTTPAGSILLQVRNMNRGEDHAPIVWAGIVRSGRRTNTVSFDVVANTLTSSLDRLGVRLAWARNCPHALYDMNCRVPRVNFAVTVTMTKITGSGFTANVGALPSGWFAGGYVEFMNKAGYKDSRPIEAHAGTTITLLGATDGMVEGTSAVLYPGCNRTTSDCEDKFDNLDNYGGFPHLPNKSPFDGDPVF